MKVFISYATIDVNLAESIAIRLRESRYKVFFDRQKLEPGCAYDQRIRDFLQQADLFIFLARPESIAPGAYAMTEMEWFKKAFPRPADRVLTYKTQPIPLQSIPPYLRSITVPEAAGDPAADVFGHALLILERKKKKRLLTFGMIAIACLTGALTTTMFLNDGITLTLDEEDVYPGSEWVIKVDQRDQPDDLTSLKDELISNLTPHDTRVPGYNRKYTIDMLRIARSPEEKGKWWLVMDCYTEQIPGTDIHKEPNETKREHENALFEIKRFTASGQLGEGMADQFKNAEVKQMKMK
jgi:hypothetical protein